MAKNTIVEIVDDLDGSRNAEEMAFSFQGVDYTIDLGKKNRAAFEKLMAPYIQAATKATKTTRPRSSGKRTSGKSVGELAKIRQWAQTTGIEVASRGRIPQSVVDQYRAAHQ